MYIEGNGESYNCGKMAIPLIKLGKTWKSHVFTCSCRTPTLVTKNFILSYFCLYTSWSV